MFTANVLKENLNKSLQIIRNYDWLLDSYVLDFYVENHWEKLCRTWRKDLDEIEPEKLHELLDSKLDSVQCVWPLSLLALRRALNVLSISRNVIYEDKLSSFTLIEHPKMRHIFTKSVKPKKLHEIKRMAAICNRSCTETPVDFVIDFGAGLGHLARVLGYGYGIRVCCLEMQNELNSQGGLIDQQLENLAKKYLSLEEQAKFQRPTHVTLKLTANMDLEMFLTTIKNALQLTNNNFSFGIIGLHPCGDLGAILMRMFLNCTQAKFLNFVGCCYMKLTTPESEVSIRNKWGYPLSQHLLRKPLNETKLSYETLEISCHAIEMYCERLKSVNYENLKIHSYRAAAERILVQHSKQLRHCGLRSVKHSPGLKFNEYFKRAIENLKLSELSQISNAMQTVLSNDLKQWRRVVVFYTLRLMLAPLIESIILYDRLLFLLENDCHVSVNAIFNPRLSPRNHITTAVKL